MSRSRKNGKISVQLTDIEVSVLFALKGRRSATADEIRRELPWPSNAMMVRAALLQLEQRSLAAHSISVGQILYHPVGLPDPLNGSIATAAKHESRQFQSVGRL